MRRVAEETKITENEAEKTETGAEPQAQQEVKSEEKTAKKGYVYTRKSS